VTKEAFDFKMFLLRDRKGGPIRIRGAKAFKNSRLSDPRNRTIDEVERVQGSQGHRPLFRSRFPRFQTCPACKGVFRYPKVVDRGSGHIHLICPTCNAELGKIDHERFQAALDE
jgi:hypothetical protein